MDEATFLTNLAVGYYLQDFAAYNSTKTQGIALGPFTDGSFSYIISSPGGGIFSSYGNGFGSISTAFNEDSLLITFNGDDVTAIGGEFFLTDYSGRDMNGSVILTFSDTSTETIDSTGGIRTFYGNTFNTAITTLTITSVRPDYRDTYYPTIDHLYVGTKA